MARAVLKRSDLPSLGSRSDEEGMTYFAGEVREVYRKFLTRLEASHRMGASGLEVARMCSAGVEVIVQHLYDSLQEWMGRKVRGIPAIVALGGFGRRELSPRSDIDLLFIRGKGSGREVTSLAGYLVRMLWDSGLKLGHSVRTIAELRRALKSDMDLKTSLLDGRWICGGDRFRSELSAIKAEVSAREGGELFVAKLEDARRRWRKFGWSYHLIEPNVKESPGGLRDFHTIRWIGMILPWEGTLEGLYRLAIIDREEIGAIQRAFDFLVRTRNELHFLSQSNWNVLTVQMQRSVADGLGYVDEGDLLAVERFMRDYYSNTMAVYKVLERILEETRGRGSLRIIEGELYKRIGTKGLGQLDLRLRRERIEADPLFAFKEQLRSGRHFSPHMERRIRNMFKEERLKAGLLKRMKASFIELLQIPGKKAPVIRAMHELGVLKHIFPPFEKLTCLKRYELYHQYTADEHCLQAIFHLENLQEMRDGLLPRIYGEVAEKTELFLATLLHDIGKVNIRGHARVGARMTGDLLKAFPLPARSRSLISFLVENHLLLSHFSQRRDMEDRDTSLQFINRVKSHLNLKLLYLLTYVDLKATGEGVWTGWKEKLLEDLYFKASKLLAEKSELRDSYRRILSSRREKIVKICRGTSERERMKTHLGKLPDRYTMVVPPSRARAHLEMVDELQGRLAVMQLRRLRHSLELTVCTRDRPFRLSQLCGVITINDLNILGANAFTSEDGIVIDLFHIEGLGGRHVTPSETRRKLSEDLDAVLGGEMSLEEAYSSHVKKWKRSTREGIPVPCVVEFENDLSGESTVVDITAGDRPGLLYRVTYIFSEEGLDIQSAQITTRGGTAADSFYVRTADGKKLSDVSMMRRIRQRLMAELGSGPPDA